MVYRSNILIFGFGVLALSACVKTEIIPELVSPEISVEPASVSLTPGQNFQIVGVYTNELAEDQSALIEWRSSASDVAMVNDDALVTALAAGQAWVVGTAPNGLSDSVLVTVTDSANAVAKVVITAQQTVLETGASTQLAATAYNASNQALPMSTVNWTSSDSGVLSIDANGVVTGLNVGMASITARVDNVNSLPLVIQVTPVGGISRTGTFSGNMGYSVSGTATLKQSGSSLTLELGADFQASSGPQLGVYLAKSASGSLNTQNSLKLSNLLGNSGLQSYDVPAGVDLNEYDYVVIYCIPFTVRFGTAQLNN